jgi:hypothetical protein
MSAVQAAQNAVEPSRGSPASAIIRAALIELTARAAILGLSPVALLIIWATRDAQLEEEDEL